MIDFKSGSQKDSLIITQSFYSLPKEKKDTFKFGINSTRTWV